MDSLPIFPRNAVQISTEARLTSEIETGSGEPRPSGRPIYQLLAPIYKDFYTKALISHKLPQNHHQQPLKISKITSNYA